MARTATGIDIGLRTGKILRGYTKGNTFHVTDFCIASYKSKTIEAGWAHMDPGFKPTFARVGLTGRDMNIRYTRVPQVPDWQLRNLMRFEVEEIGDQSGSEVASDFNLLPAMPEIEGEDVVLLAMARESLLESHAEGVKAIGGTLDAFSPSAVALYNSWTHYGVVEDDTVLIANIGHDNTDVVISRGPDLLFARNLSGGSRLFDDAIAQRFSVSSAQAEKLKIQVATLRPGAQYETPNHERASRAILGAAGQLLSLLQSTVLFCKSQVKIGGLKIDRVLLCGGGAALDGLPEYLAAGMGVPAEHFDPFRVVDTSALAPEAASELDGYKLESVVALGLATMASDPDAYSLEILPRSLARKREFWGGTAWLVAAAVFAVLYLGFLAFHLSRQLDQVEGDNRILATRLDRAVRVHNETEGLVARNETLGELADELQSLAGSGEQVARFFAVTARELPGDFWITRFSSAWGYDEELGVPRGGDRPIVEMKGRAREGTDSPAVLYEGFLNALAEALPTARMNSSLSPTGDSFSIDLTLYAPPVETTDEVAEEGLE
ncbi:MAG: hypothetical protein E2O39_08175 [Planctomycetota bacterium]|nr:MAG: hypothetical protein E2O39_08175 [Planctomycetota bacterium]